MINHEKFEKNIDRLIVLIKIDSLTDEQRIEHDSILEEIKQYADELSCKEQRMGTA